MYVIPCQTLGIVAYDTFTISYDRSKSPRRTPSLTGRTDSFLNVANLALKHHDFSPRAPDLSPSMDANVRFVLLYALPRVKRM